MVSRVLVLILAICMIHAAQATSEHVKSYRGIFSTSSTDSLNVGNVGVKKVGLKSTADDFKNAETLHSGDIYCYLIKNGERKYYKFYVIVSSVVDIRVMPIKGDPDLYVFSPDHLPLGCSAHAGRTVDELVFKASDTGYFYAVVYGYEGGVYCISLNIDGPTTIKVGETVSGSVNHRESKMYAVWLEKGGIYKVKLHPLSGDPDLYVYDENAKTVGGSGRFDLEDDKVTIRARYTGYYLIEVYGYRASNYELSVLEPVTVAVEDYSKFVVLNWMPWEREKVKLQIMKNGRIYTETDWRNDGELYVTVVKKDDDEKFIRIVTEEGYKSGWIKVPPVAAYRTTSMDLNNSRVGEKIFATLAVIVVGVVSVGLTIWDCIHEDWGWDCLWNIGAEIVTTAVPSVKIAKVVKIIEIAEGGKVTVKLISVLDRAYQFFKDLGILTESIDGAGTIKKFANFAELVARSDRVEKVIEGARRVQGKLSLEDLDKLAKVINPNDKKTPILEIVLRKIGDGKVNANSKVFEMKTAAKVIDRGENIIVFSGNYLGKEWDVLTNRAIYECKNIGKDASREAIINDLKTAVNQLRDRAEILKSRELVVAIPTESLENIIKKYPEWKSYLKMNGVHKVALVSNSGVEFIDLRR